MVRWETDIVFTTNENFNTGKMKADRVKMSKGKIVFNCNYISYYPFSIKIPKKYEKMAIEVPHWNFTLIIPEVLPDWLDGIFELRLLRDLDKKIYGNNMIFLQELDYSVRDLRKPDKELFDYEIDENSKMDKILFGDLIKKEKKKGVEKKEENGDSYVLDGNVL